MLAALRKRDIETFVKHLEEQEIKMTTNEYLNTYANCLVDEKDKLKILGLVENGLIYSWFEGVIRYDLHILKHLTIGIDARKKGELPTIVLLLSPQPVKWIYAVDSITTKHKSSGTIVVCKKTTFFGEEHKEDVESSFVECRGVFTCFNSKIV